MEDFDSVRMGANSSLSINQDERSDDASPILNKILPAGKPQRNMLIKSNIGKEDEPWAEVAKFNKLLEKKIILDEASE